jgi:cell wall assembly regulator SMI1
MIEYQEARPPADPGSVDRLEQTVGRSLPPAYREYLLGQDGGRAVDNSLAVDEVFGVGEDAPYERNIWKKMAVFARRHPEWLLPVAEDVYGNLFALSLRETDFGSVWFWDHEEEADEGEPPAEDNITLTAESWPAFLAMMQPITEDDDQP